MKNFSNKTHSKKMLIKYENNENETMKKEISDDLNFAYERINEIYIDLKKAKKQCRLEIQGIEVYFPYNPYKLQLEYMEKGIFI